MHEETVREGGGGGPRLALDLRHVAVVGRVMQMKGAKECLKGTSVTFCRRQSQSQSQSQSWTSGGRHDGHGRVWICASCGTDVRAAKPSVGFDLGAAGEQSSACLCFR